MELQLKTSFIKDIQQNKMYFNYVMVTFCISFLF